MLATVKTLRRLLTAAWVVAVLGLIGLAVFTRVGQTYIIRGGSMEPAIQLGSVIRVEPVTAGALRPGDIVTIRADNGVVYTHRATRVVEAEGAVFIQTRGDANDAADPYLVPMSAVLGRVDAILPGLGYLAAMMANAWGLASLLSMLATLLVAIWLFEEMEADLELERLIRRRGAARLGMGSPGDARA